MKVENTFLHISIYEQTWTRAANYKSVLPEVRDYVTSGLFIFILLCFLFVLSSTFLLFFVPPLIESFIISHA